MTNEAKFIFSCNKMPLFKDKTDGLYRRLEILEITNKIAVKDRNSNLLEEFTHEDMQYLLWRSFLQINFALQNDRLIETTCCQEALEKFRTQSSTLLSFMKSGESSDYGKTVEELELADQYIGSSVAKKYHDYLTWCVENGKSRQSLENFVDNICGEFDLVVKKGKFEKREA
jgi:putative DNA primase/helicase